MPCRPVRTTKLTQDKNDEKPQDVDRLVEQLFKRADADQAQLLGPGGLLTPLTQRVLNRALDVELAEHLGPVKTSSPPRTRTAPTVHKREDGYKIQPHRGVNDDVRERWYRSLRTSHRTRCHGLRVGQDPQVPTAACPRGACRTRRRELCTTRAIASTCGTTVVAAGTGFADGLGEGGQVVVIGGGRGEAAFVTDHLPAFGGGDARSVYLAQVPGMRLCDGRQWTHDSGGIRVHVRQRRNGRMLTRRPAATTRTSHPTRVLSRTEVFVTTRLRRVDTMESGPATSTCTPRSTAHTGYGFRPTETPYRSILLSV